MSGGGGAAGNAAVVAVGGASGGGAAIAEELLLADVAFLVVGDDLGHLVGVLLAVTDAPLGEEVVLDPDDLVEGADEGDLALQRQLRVGHDGLDEDIGDETEEGANVDVLDIEGVHTSLAGMHLSCPLLAGFSLRVS